MRPVLEARLAAAACALALVVAAAPAAGQPAPTGPAPQPGAAPAAPPPYGVPQPWADPRQGQMVLPPTLEYGEGELVPPGYHVETRSNLALIITGLSLFGTGYVIGVSMSGIDDELNPLAIPLAGPFIAIGTTKAEAGGKFALLSMGASQGLGVAMTVVGLAMQTPILVRDTTARVVVTPRNDGAAAGLTGAF
jgi:hypothetical protein